VPGAGGGSASATVSDDGNLVAFESTMNNLSPADLSLHSDIFLRNRSAQTTTLVSVNSDEVQSNYINDSPAISADGQFVAFISGADNLVPNDPNLYDVFVRDHGRDRLTSVTTDEQHMTGGDAHRLRSAGTTVRGLRHVREHLDPTDTVYSSDIFVRDRLLGTTERISATPVAEAGDDSFTPSISNDGGVVGFESLAKDLVSDDTNNKSDAFVHAYDLDLDGVADWVDNCPTVANTAGQADDVDGDWAGNACDAPGTGNVDCNQEVNAVDALKILRKVAGLSVVQEACGTSASDRLRFPAGRCGL
jgi:Tol biopolymer transport system component